MKLVDGSYQAVTQVKVLSPETTNIGRVDSVHLLEDEILLCGRASTALLPGV
jgi:hypothetical protein